MLDLADGPWIGVFVVLISDYPKRHTMWSFSGSVESTSDSAPQFHRQIVFFFFCFCFFTAIF